MPSPNPSSDAVLTNVSCSTASSCVAIGLAVTSDGFTQPLIEKWDGSIWSIAAAPALHSTQMTGVKCTNATNCYTVGSSGSATLIELWDGATWSVSISPNPRGAFFSFLNDVACPSATTCDAVGGFSRRTDLLIAYTLAERLV